MCTMRGEMAVGIIAAIRPTCARKHDRAFNGIDSGHITVRVAQFRRLRGSFHQQLSSTLRHRVGKAHT
jgi:hypothetical protein